MARRWKISKLAVALAAALGTMAPVARAADSALHWVPAYMSAPAAPIRDVPPEVIPPPQEISGTIRYRLTLWAEGDQVVLRLSNEAGTSPLRIDHATIAFPGGAGTGFVDVTFGGSPGITVPAGTPALSDPLPLSVKPGSDVLVSLFLPERFTHSQSDGMRPAEYVAGADRTTAPSLSNPGQIFVRPIVSAIFVRPRSAVPDVIVAFGDSITDGTGVKSPDIRGWPDLLSARLMKQNVSGLTVANAGISGNRLLADGWGISALARFDRDVLALPSVKHVILLEGINDIGSIGRDNNPDVPVTFTTIVASFRQLIERAHQRQIRVICATILPFEGSFYFSEAKEALRQKVNQWLRTSPDCDARIDFDQVMRDPASPQRLKTIFDSGDHLHPNDLGYKAMAQFIEIGIFGKDFGAKALEQ
jgi:lysophospholipase L1-like esterase